MKNIPRLQGANGCLYVIATPLGNLQDMSARAIETLKSVTAIAAEDTRHSLPLLKHYGISKPLISLHEHNERERTALLIKRLQAGESIALISDAGTPLISDPGYTLVHQARALGIPVSPIPGPCAAIAALSVAGLPTDRFTFEGFLPTRKKDRQHRLDLLKQETRTMIFYEAPHRILSLLEELQRLLGGERPAVLARELTKRYETIHADCLQKLMDWVKAEADQQRGEMVVVVEGTTAVTPAQTKTIEADQLLVELLQHLPVKTAAEITAKITQEKKNVLYQKALKLKG